MDCPGKALWFASTNSIFVDSTGRVGFRTSTPVLDLHVNTSNTPAARLEQNSSGGFTAQTWDIAVETGGGRLELREGGASMLIDGEEVAREPEREYPGIYRRFAALLAARESDVDASPLRICADAFLLGKRRFTEPFHD